MDFVVIYKYQIRLCVGKVPAAYYHPSHDNEGNGRKGGGKYEEIIGNNNKTPSYTRAFS